jgi:glycosyltransferase involved in cell wall biosynthesis
VERVLVANLERDVILDRGGVGLSKKGQPCQDNLTTPRHCLVLMHPLDPRGQKIGGIESHVRLMLEHAPVDWKVLFVGVDGQGDCRLGEIHQMTFNGRTFDFLPVLFYPEGRIHEAAKGISQSITMRFMLGVLRYFRSIKRAIGRVPASFELQRFEFSLVPFLMRFPTVQVVHGEGSREDKMDSLIKKYWFVHRLNEEIALRLARRIIGVNPNILARLEKTNPNLLSRAVFMPVPVDTKVFQTRDFDVSDNVLRIIFAGRLDEFKDPPTMFRVLARVRELLGGACEFHYVGLSDPYRYAEFSLVEKFTVRHGFQRPSTVANLMGHCHMGILTSFFEGMPCYLLELLSVGRPVAAVRLPQYDLVIEEGVSGTMIERAVDSGSVIERMAAQIVAMWRQIQDGKISPRVIHAKAAPFAVDRQLRDHFARHQRLGHV